MQMPIPRSTVFASYCQQRRNDTKIVRSITLISSTNPEIRRSQRDTGRRKSTSTMIDRRMNARNDHCKLHLQRIAANRSAGLNRFPELWAATNHFVSLRILVTNFRCKCGSGPRFSTRSPSRPSFNFSPSVEGQSARNELPWLQKWTLPNRTW